MSDTRMVFVTVGEFAGRYIEFPVEHAERGISEGWALDQTGLDALTIEAKLNEITDEDRSAALESYNQFVAERDAPEDQKEEVKSRGRPKMTDEEKAAKAAERAEAKRQADEKKAADDAALKAQADADAKAAAKKAEKAAKAGDDAGTVAAIDEGVAANLGNG